MSLFSIFDRGERARARSPLEATAPAVVPSFAERAAQRLTDLSVVSRQAGRDLSPEAYSLLRSIEDAIRPAIADAAEHPILPEREFAVESMLTDLVPSTVAAFRRIAASERRPGSAADVSLRRQLGMLAESASEISTLVKQDAVSALEANALFLRERLN